MTPEAPPILAETDLGAVRHNARVLAALAAPAALMGVVKADAYGHGAVPVAKALIEEGVGHLAVAYVSEAVALREAGVRVPVLVFGAPLAEALPAYARLGLGVTVASREGAVNVAEAAAAYGPLAAHVKVDTGMHRLGVPPEAAADVLAALHGAPGVTVRSLWTHLATADGDLAFAHSQLDRFDTLLAELGPLAPEAEGGSPEARAPAVHVANGPLLLREPRRAAREGALVRVGGVLYGLASSPTLQPALDAAGLRPALRLTTRVVHLQTVTRGEGVSYGLAWRAPEPRRIATLAAGYADGVPRSLSGSGHVGIGGRLVPIVGRVCMDMLMVDLGPPHSPEASGVRLGDEAVLFGRGGPSARVQAEAAGTISYELTCGIAPRVARAWHEGRAGD